jgi:hypothetical protein
MVPAVIPYRQQPPGNAAINWGNGVTRDLIAAAAQPQYAAWLRGAGHVRAEFPTAPAFGVSTKMGKYIDATGASTETVAFNGLPPHDAPFSVLVEFLTTATTAGQKSIVAYGGRNANTDGWTIWQASTNLGLTFGGVANYQVSGITLVADVEYTAMWRVTGNGGTLQVIVRRKDTGQITISTAVAVGTMVGTTSNPLTLAAAWNATSYDNAFPGRIGSFAVWSRCLTLAEAINLVVDPYQLWGFPRRAQLAAVTADPASALTGYDTYFNYDVAKNRTFDFDGDTVFVDTTTGEGYWKLWDYNGSETAYFDSMSAGAAPWIQKVTDTAIGETVTRVQLFATDVESLGGGFRTSLLSFDIQRYQLYMLDLEFKLAAGWDFNMLNGDGGIWQIKSNGPRTGQAGHPSMSFNLDNQSLQFALLYPQTGLDAGSWPSSITWTAGGYASTSFSNQTLQADRYYQLRVLFYADDRPPQFGGMGYAKVWIDGQLWVDHSGPCIQPDQSDEHRMDISWYQWEGQPNATRTVYFRKAHLYYLRQPPAAALLGAG